MFLPFTGAVFAPTQVQGMFLPNFEPKSKKFRGKPAKL